MTVLAPGSYLHLHLVFQGVPLVPFALMVPKNKQSDYPQILQQEPIKVK